MSDSNPTIERLQALLGPAIADLGLELWGIDFRPGRGRSLLRLYIDAPDRAVTLDDCERASRESSALLDVEDPIQGQYTLEVSSPGWERPLFHPEQYARYPGETVKIQLALPLNGRRRLQGRILRVEAGSVTIELDGKELAVPFGNIGQARLSPDFETWKAQAAADQAAADEVQPAAGRSGARRKSH